MSLAHGLVDHDGNDSLPVQRGPAAKVGGTLVGVGTCNHCGVWKLTARGGKVR
jgi:hypothetical protein